MLNRRSVLATGALAAIPLAAPVGALAQNRKDAVVLAMTLEPPGLDPTAGAASAIAEIVQYNIFETLTKINPDGSVSPLLAESWEVSPDLKTYTFKLRKGVKFQNGEPFNAAAVKFSYDRAGGEKSTNKDKRTFANLTTQMVDEHTLVVLNKDIDPDLLFALGGDVFLDGDGHPVEQPLGLAALPAGFALAGLRQRVLRPQQVGGADVGLPALHVCQHSLRDLHGGQRALAVGGQQVLGGQVVQCGHGWGSFQ